jgi:hypothetical protein
MPGFAPGMTFFGQMKPAVRPRLASSAAVSTMTAQVVYTSTASSIPELENGTT